MEQKEIDRILGLMRNRDHLGLLKVEEQLMVLRSLADEVPGLLAKVIEHKMGVVDPELHKANAAAVEAMKERDAMVLQIEELKKVCAERGSFGLKVAYDLKESNRLNDAFRRALTDVMQFSSDDRSRAVAKGILEAHGGPDLEAMVKRLCRSSFGTLGNGIPCELPEGHEMPHKTGGSPNDPDLEWNS